MTKTEKYLVSLLALAVVVLGAYVITHKSVNTTTVVKSFGATGDTYAQKSLASVGVNVATITPAFLFNNSGRDRIVTDVFTTLNTPNVYGTTTIYNIVASNSTNQY